MPTPMVAEAAVVEAVGPVVVVPAAVLVRAAVEELAPLERELEADRELRALVAAGTVMTSGFLTPVHTDGFTRTTSE